MPDDVELWGGALCVADLTRIGFVARVDERSSAADHGCGDPAAMIRIARGMPPRRSRNAAGARSRMRKAARRRRASPRVAATRTS